MKRLHVIPILIFAAMATVGYGFLNAPAPDEERQRVIDLFENEYRASEIKEIKWSGNAERCEPGDISADTRKKARQRINYYRKMAGLNNNIVFNEQYNRETQAGAALMQANHILTHTPLPRMKCYSDVAYEGCYHSNIAELIKGHYSRVITDLIEDPGERNYKLGHRRWLLFSGSTTMGFGATPEYYALHVTGPENLRPVAGELPEKICWPPAGMVPYQLVFRRWSFSIPKDSGKIDIKNAKVSMKVNGRALAGKVVARDDSYGDPTVVWDVTSLREDFHYDYYNETVKKEALQEAGILEQNVVVKVSGITIDGESKTFTYEVKAIDPSRS